MENNTSCLIASFAYILDFAALAIFFGMGFHEQFRSSGIAKIIVLLAMIGLLVIWFVILANIYADAKKRNWPTAWIALGFFLGPLGGIIYYLISKSKPSM